MRVVNQSVTLNWVTPRALEMIEAAGRVCYRSEDRIAPGTAEPFIRKLIQAGHESVLEHAVASFHIVTDRGVSHQLVRHRIASFAQESTRYCNYGKTDGEIQVIKPLTGVTPHQWNIMKRAMEHAEEAYLVSLGAGVAPQNARFVLPTGLKTELHMTANFREWRTVLKQRVSKKAHPQMRALAHDVLMFFQSEFPVIVEDIKEDV